MIKLSEKDLKNERAEFMYDYLDDGDYTARVHYKGNEQFFSSYNSADFTIFDTSINQKRSPIINLELGLNNISYRETVPFTIKVRDTTNKSIGNTYVYLIINGEEYSYSLDENGIVTGYISFTKAGTQKIYARIKESDKFYSAVTETKQVYVKKIHTTMNVSDSTTYISKNGTIYVTVTADDNAKISGKLVIQLKKGEKLKMTYNKTLTDGKATITIPASDLEVGTYTVNTEYKGTDVYESSTYISSLTIDQKLRSQLTLSTVTSDVYIGDTQTVTCTLNQNDGTIIPSKKIFLYVIHDGTTETSALTCDENGKVTTTINYTALGNYSIYAEFQGSDSLNACVSSTINVNVVKIPTVLSVTCTNPTVYEGSTLTFNVELYDVRGKLRSESETITMIRGESNTTYNVVYNSHSKHLINKAIQITGETTDHNITFSFAGNDNFEAISKTTTVTVKPKETTTMTITGFEGSAYINRAIPYSIKLSGDTTIPAGQTVRITFTLGDTTDTITKVTNSTGEISDSYIFTNIGDYVITAYFNGNYQYNSTSKATTEKITKVGTTIIVNDNFNSYALSDTIIPVTVTASDNSTVTGDVEVTLTKQD